MANTFLLSSPNTLLSSTVTSYSSSSRRGVTLLKAFSSNNDTPPSPFPSSSVCSKRGLTLGFMSSLVMGVIGVDRRLNEANAAILEADDDIELLERVKKDRKKRIEKQGVLSSSDKEKGYLQDLVYKLSKVGQAIESNDLSAASSVLGATIDTDWVKRVNVAFTKLSLSQEEKTQVDTFNSSLASLISSVSKNDVESAKLAFVSSATAFEKWTALTGLLEQLKGL